MSQNAESGFRGSLLYSRHTRATHNVLFDLQGNLRIKDLQTFLLSCLRLKFFWEGDTLLVTLIARYFFLGGGGGEPCILNADMEKRMMHLPSWPTADTGTA